MAKSIEILAKKAK